MSDIEKSSKSYKILPPVAKYSATSHRYQGGRWSCDGKLPRLVVVSFCFVSFIYRLNFINKLTIISIVLSLCRAFRGYMEKVLNFLVRTSSLPPLRCPPLPNKINPSFKHRMIVAVLQLTTFRNRILFVYFVYLRYSQEVNKQGAGPGPGREFYLFFSQR